MGIRLSVNLNKVATIRNARGGRVPDVVHCARLCLDAGAHGITIHPRPDARHIRAADVHELAAFMRSEQPSAELNIEGNPFERGFLEYAETARPAQCTLVPDSPTQATSDHGWDAATIRRELGPIVDQLHRCGCRTSIFVDADPLVMAAVRDVGANRIELYTEPFASAFAGGDASAQLARFAQAADAAVTLGLGVNAGHDLNLQNLPSFVRALPNLLEVSIGHALIADALEYGLPSTVAKYRAALD